jgi:hypothetical protein
LTRTLEDAHDRRVRPFPRRDEERKKAVEALGSALEVHSSR